MATRRGWYRPVLVVLFAVAALLHSGWVQPAAAEVDGYTYTSPQYGFTITWNDAWFVREEDSTQDWDYLYLADGYTDLYFYAGPESSSSPESSVASTLSQLHSDPIFTDIAPMRDNIGDAIRFSDENRAYAAFTLTQTNEDGSIADLGVYLESRPIAPGVFLSVVAFVYIEDFEAERPKIEQVINSFNPNPSPVPTPEPEPTRTPEPEPTATPEPEQVLVPGEPAPVFVSGTWRVAVAAAALNTELAGVELEAKARKEWLAVVLDVTNWSNANAELSAEAFQVRYEDRDEPITIAPSSTLKVAAFLELAPATKEYTVEIDAGATARVVVVYSLPSGRQGLELLQGDVAIPLDDLVAVDLPPDDLPAPAGPPETVSGEVLSAADANTLNIRLAGETRSERIRLLGVEPLDESSCVAEEAKQLLNGLAGEVVLVEEDNKLTGGATPARYVWLTNEDGTRTLLNHLLIAEGMVQASSLPAAARFGLWLETTERSAATDQIDLLTGCVAQETASEILSQKPDATSTGEADR